MNKPCDTDVLSAAELEFFLNGRNFEYYDLISSTNDRAKELAKCGCAAGTVVIADSQNAGRGRFDRKFISRSGAGLYMSVVLRDIPISEGTKITPLAAVASYEALLSFDVQNVKIKWVNDLYLNEKKICGILTESAAVGDKIDYAVVGIGVNLGKNEFPDELNDKATSIFNETGKVIPRAALAAEIVKRLETPPKDFMRTYSEQSCVIGKFVRVSNGNANFRARIKRIDENGFLVAEIGNGEIIVTSGEVIME